MKSKHAIAVLHTMNVKLVDRKAGTFDPWFTQLQSYTITFFGADSPESQYLKYFTLSSFGVGGTDWLIEQSKVSLKSFVDACIETIQVRGLHRKDNFLYKINDKILIAIFTVVLPGIFISGYNVGKATLNNKIERVENENKDLKEKLSTTLPASPDKLIKTDSSQKAKSDTNANR